MREVKVGGLSVNIRGLRLAEVSSAKMRKLGYGRFLFRPHIPDGEEAELFMAACQDAALNLVLTDDEYSAVDTEAGARGLSAVWKAILEETYGGPGEEKNSLSAGNGKSTPSESNTAGPAERQSATNVQSVDTEYLPSLYP